MGCQLRLQSVRIATRVQPATYWRSCLVGPKHAPIAAPAIFPPPPGPRPAARVHLDDLIITRATNTVHRAQLDMRPMPQR